MVEPQRPARPEDSSNPPVRRPPDGLTDGRPAALSRFRQAAALDPPIAQLIEQGLDLAWRALQVDFCLYATRQPGATAFLVNAACGLPALGTPGSLDAGPRTLAGRAHLTGDCVIVEDLVQMPVPGLERFLVAAGARSALVAPVRDQRGAAAILGAFTFHRHQFAPDDPAFLHRVAGTLAAALYRRDWRQRAGEDRRWPHDPRE